MAAKLTRLTHRIAIQLHIVAESCMNCSSRSRLPVRKLLDTNSYASKDNSGCQLADLSLERIIASRYYGF